MCWRREGGGGREVSPHLLLFLPFPCRTFAFCDEHLFRVGERQVPANLEVGGASDWFTLHRGFAEYAVSNATFVLELRQFFDYTLLSAESFFHMLILNSRYGIGTGERGKLIFNFLARPASAKATWRATFARRGGSTAVAATARCVCICACRASVEFPSLPISSTATWSTGVAARRRTLRWPTCGGCASPASTQTISRASSKLPPATG